jgi:hypothetical protein
VLNQAPYPAGSLGWAITAYATHELPNQTGEEHAHHERVLGMLVQFFGPTHPIDRLTGDDPMRDKPRPLGRGGCQLMVYRAARTL